MNKKLLLSFTEYCFEHPNERFWQALRNWNMETNPKQNFILTAELADDLITNWKNEDDTFYRD